MFDISFYGAFMAGLLSFLSPCILPIVPFYLSYMAGVSINHISDGGEIPAHTRRRAVITTICFAAGIIVVFVAMGATSFWFGQMLRDYFDILRWAAAALIFVMGLHFLGVIRISLLYRQFRMDAGSTSNVGYLGAFAIGLAFAFGWTPCAGPALAAILFVAAGAATAWKGMFLLFLFGFGMTLPFILAAFFIMPFMRWMSDFRKHLPLIEKLMGAMLIIFAILIATNSINIIAQWMLSIAPDIGTLR